MRPSKGRAGQELRSERDAGGRVDRSADRSGGRSGMAEIQRARMIAGMAEVTRERGVGGVAIAHVVARSGVSRRTFYELFRDRDDCFAAALELAVERAARRMIPAYQEAGAWQERMRAGVAALLEFLEDEPNLGALCVVDALGAGPSMLERRNQVIEVLVDAVDEGRLHARGSLQPTRLTAEGVVGAVLAVLHARLTAGATGKRREVSQPPMAALAGPLTGTIVLPYLGAAAAARETARPAPVHAKREQVAADPLRDLGMRLTYRTMRVLQAIARRPRASNRQIADAAGVHDQGQISKLLARLEHLGLIRNGGTGGARGEPNAWTLTSQGEQIARAIGQGTVLAAD